MWEACRLVKSGKVSAEAFAEAVWQSFASRPPLGEIAIREGVLKMPQLFEILSDQADNGRPFGVTAMELGHLTTEQLAGLLLVQEDLATAVEDLLVEMGELAPEHLRVANRGSEKDSSQKCAAN